MGSGAVMRPDSYVDFGLHKTVCLFNFITFSFLTHLLPDLSTASSRELFRFQVSRPEVRSQESTKSGFSFFWVNFML